MNITYTNSNEFILSPKQVIQMSTSTGSKHCLYLTKVKMNLINRWVNISYTNLFFSLRQLPLNFHLYIDIPAVTGKRKFLKNIKVQRSFRDSSTVLPWMVQKLIKEYKWAMQMKSLLNVDVLCVILISCLVKSFIY